ncbi:MAG: FkbM family methyltransferase [Patescibacteria group bacterium]|nr:FkbM family methyltransferase [Patescibacteria group bacterium]MDE1943992.1 FkbM family methyltransferase [Patescibacteria group bacterium]MDE1945062.1 FkbM family methyltransferase [Patescibacteria group bacterium]MDE2057706.1 FkbM family methyltransferase [Patescibacteria group bacterium]
MRKRLFGRAPKLLRLTLAGAAYPFWVRDGLDIAVLREMFVDRQYAIPGADAGAPRHVADLGAHIGGATLYLHARYPGVSITAYEPDPDNYALLVRNVGGLSGVRTVHAAVAPTKGSITLYRHAGGSTRATVSRDPDTTEAIEVPATTLAEVAASGADWIKFDIEGAEHELFRRAGRALDTCTLLFGEYHPLLTHHTPAEFEALFPGWRCRWHGSVVCFRRGISP